VTIQAQPDVVVQSTIETDDGDHDRFTHLVLEGYTKKSGKFVPLKNSVVEGMVNATPVRSVWKSVGAGSRSREIPALYHL
jgi:hypothetical protein